MVDRSLEQGYLEVTVRVINSPRLWDNRFQKKSRYLPRAMFLSAILLGLVIASGAIMINSHVNATKKTANPAASAYITLASAIPALPESKQLLPEQNHLGDLLLHKLATPPPLPPADCAAVACIALTFDDGPNADSTTVILDALQKEDVKATFFVIGNKVAPNSALVQRMYSQGDEIGNHSWAHPDFTRLTGVQITQQIDLTQAAITAAGAPAPTIFRAPYGSINPYTKQQVHLPIILWNVDPKDWRETDSNKIVQLVETQAKPGAIILMHDKPATAGAVSKIIEDLKTKYRLVTVSELLNITPGTQGVFIGR